MLFNAGVQEEAPFVSTTFRDAFLVAVLIFAPPKMVLKRRRVRFHHHPCK